MTRFHKHFFINLLILAQANSYVVEINGELSFEMRLTDVLVPFERASERDDHDMKKLEKGKLKGHNEIKRGLKKDQTELKTEESGKDRNITHQGRPSGVTAAPMVECLYQYPDLEQFNAMLSHMMNELTKVFVRFHQMMRSSGGSRRQETRFRVVDKIDTSFFEDIYNNMTREYRQFYNNTAERVARAGEDPCENQEELKEVWRNLIKRSLTSLRRAAQRCIEEFLHAKNRSDDVKTKYKLRQYLVRELSRIRSRQLHMLCDSFQLCYNELL